MWLGFKGEHGNDRKPAFRESTVRQQENRETLEDQRLETLAPFAVSRGPPSPACREKVAAIPHAQRSSQGPCLVLGLGYSVFPQCLSFSVPRNQDLCWRQVFPSPDCNLQQRALTTCETTPDYRRHGTSCSNAALEVGRRSSSSAIHIRTWNDGKCSALMDFWVFYPYAISSQNHVTMVTMVDCWPACARLEQKGKECARPSYLLQALRVSWTHVREPPPPSLPARFAAPS